MPVLTDSRTTKKVTLVALEGGEVEIFSTFLAGDVDRLHREGGVDAMSVLSMLTAIIKSWNLTDEKGEVLPVTRETVGMLNIADMNAIVEASDFNAQFSKKALAPSSSAS